jgi:hypothetical protein
MAWGRPLRPSSTSRIMPSATRSVPVKARSRVTTVALVKISSETIERLFTTMFIIPRTSVHRRHWGSRPVSFQPS